MIIKTISAENFGKFDRYSVNLDDNINVFYGNNEAGKSTLYQIISTLLFAPSTPEELAESNKLIKKGEKYARVYAIINIKGKEVSVAREIYQNNTNLSIAEKEEVSALGNVNVPFIGDLSKDMYENLHTIDYYNMATITNNVWEQIKKMIQQTQGAPRKTPLFVADDELEDEILSPYMAEIKELEKKDKDLRSKLKESKQSQIKMIKNQETIDKFESSLEDVEHNIELESSYLREANKMNSIRSTIKKTQDLALELEKYKKLEPYMADLRERYEFLKEYSYRKENNLPVDDLLPVQEEEIEETVQDAVEMPETVTEEATAQEPEKTFVEEIVAEGKRVEKQPEVQPEIIKSEEVSAETSIEPEKIIEPIIEAAKPVETAEKVEMQQTSVVDIPEKTEVHKEPEMIEEPKAEQAEEDIDEEDEAIVLNEEMFTNQKVKEAIARIKNKTQLPNSEDKFNNKTMKVNPYDVEVDSVETEDSNEVLYSNNDDVLQRARRLRNMYGQSNPYADSYPDMSKTNYSHADISKIDDDDDDGYSYFADENEKEPSISAIVDELDIEITENNEAEEIAEEITDYDIIKMGDSLNQIDEDAIRIAQEKAKILSEEDEKSLDNSFTAFTRVVNRNLSEYEDIDEVLDTLKDIEVGEINKSVVEYRELSRTLRKMEHSVNRMETSANTNARVIVLAAISFVCMVLGVASFFIEQLVTYVPQLEVVSRIIMSLPYKNYFAGGAFVLIGILLVVASLLGTDNSYVEKIATDEVEMDDIRNKLRGAKRRIIDSLKSLPIPPEYLDNPSNLIVQTVSEIKSAYNDYLDLKKKLTTPVSADINLADELTEKFLKNDASDDVFENIKKLRTMVEETKQKAESKKTVPNFGFNNYDSQNIDKTVKTSYEPATNSSFGNNQSFGNSTFDNIGLNNQAQHQAPNQVSNQIPNQVPEQAPEQEINPVANDNIPVQNEPAAAMDFGGPGSMRISNKIMSTDYNNPDESQFTEPVNSDDNSDNIVFGGGLSSDNNGYDPMDTSYPTGDGLSSSNNSYDPMDTSYPTGDGLSSSNNGYDPMDTSYPTDNGLNSSDGGYDTMDTSYPGNNQTEDTSGNPYGIPGLKLNDYNADNSGFTSDNKPVDDTPMKANEFLEEQEKEEKQFDNQFGMSEETKLTDENDSADDKLDIPSAFASDTSDDENNPYGIPGINKYDGSSTESEQTEQGKPYTGDIKKFDLNESGGLESSEDNSFGIPGLRFYGSGSSESTDSSGFGNNDIPYSDNENSSDNTDFVFSYINSVGQEEPEPEKMETAQEIVPQLIPSDDELVQETPRASIDEIVEADKEIVEQTSELPAEGIQTSQEETTAEGEQILTEETVQEQIEEIAQTDTDPISETVIAPITEEVVPVVVPETPAVNTEQVVVQEVPAAIKPVETVAEPEPVIIAEPEIEPEPEPVREKDELEKEFDELLELLGDNPEETIDMIYSLQENLKNEVENRDKAMEEIIQHNDAAIRLSTLSSSNWPYKKKAINSSRERIEDLHTERVKLKTQLDILLSRQQKIAYSDTPQAISDEIRFIEDKVSKLKLENDKFVIAQELLKQQGNDKVSIDYDRSHVIEDTSTYMKELTLGKYDMVKINEEKTGLSIRDKDGEWFDTTKVRLSQATREQLYLSLRISIADYFDDKSLIFPMFFDEALITWDKKRMHAVMRLLSKMSAHRQVIIFTCHDWLKTMIQDYLIGANIIEM